LRLATAARFRGLKVKDWKVQTLEGLMLWVEAGNLFMVDKVKI
jgi:hypothetical protein